MAADQQEEKSQLRGDCAMPANSVTLVSMDGDSFVVEASTIMVSQLIKVMVDGESPCCQLYRLLLRVLLVEPVYSS